ncbi:Fe-S cluster assembly protein HesB [Nonomuraea deserti]|uniref:Fe-S cluster assembly protein HesB n=1 Tax=Nonomuraea deserti TaxID=1848322 RepID=A0A4R4VK24_9ACTN|nr:HhH-GPD-type base excision DNA repair protein [Nonomuraea deserti]TDD02475.1 Fe-S cluster assembly protein HesB [Nonomuraea deserti]
MRIQLAQRSEADELLGRSPLALLVGMLLDQQIPMEWAFTGPHTISQRLGHDLTAEELASYEPEEFAALLAQPPAVHRYPKAMAGRIQQLAAYLVEHYDGRPERIWAEATDGKDLFKRLNALPGYGKQKAQIFLALLGKQLEVQPSGWREAAGLYGEEGAHRSVADVVDADSLGRVRAAKQEAKRAAKAR